MSSKKAIYKKIQEDIEKDLYQAIRLIGVNEKKERIPLIPYTKINHDPEERRKNLLYRFKHIQHQLDKILPKGEYYIEAKTGKGTTALHDSYKIVIEERTGSPVNPNSENVNLQEYYQDKTFEQEEMENISLEDHIDLIKQVERLKAENAVLLTQLKLEQESKNLADSSSAGGIGKMLEDNLPTALGIFQKFMDQRDEQIKLKNRELDLKSKGSFLKKKKTGTATASREQILKEMEALEQSDPDSFNLTLDEMEEKDPDLYNWICDQMGLEEESEEEQE